MINGHNTSIRTVIAPPTTLPLSQEAANPPSAPISHDITNVSTILPEVDHVENHLYFGASLDIIVSYNLEFQQRIAL